METPKKAELEFARVARALAKGDGANLPFREGMGTGSMFVGKKMFAVLDSSGDLVVKLDPNRVTELIQKGDGIGWHPGTGQPLKEYIAVPFRRRSLWLRLAREAREYIRLKR